MRRIGISFIGTDRGIRPDVLAREVEARGFESIWLPEHSHIPVSRESPWPGSLSGDPLPDEYTRLPDVFVSLSMAAAVTSVLRLGTSVLLLAQRDAIWTSKQIATLDHWSGGRVEVGVGIGWNREEMEGHGAAFATRWTRTRETVEAMRAIWSADVAAYEGSLVHVAPSWQWPKPAAPAGPKVSLGGGAGPRLLGEVARWADGWMPISARPSLASRLGLLREACDRIGRDVAEVEVSVFGATTSAAGLDTLFAEGVHRAVLTLPSDEPGDVLRHLDDWAPLVAG